MSGARELSRARTTEAIMAAARSELAGNSPGAWSMRAVARDVGMVSSAIYRYFATREALITALIVESFGNLDRALGSAVDALPAHQRSARWRALATALRDWSRAVPHEFQLVYGTPIPGYVAPPETIPAAAGVAQHFLNVGAVDVVPGFDQPELTQQMAQLVELGDNLEHSGTAAVIAELTALIGFVSLELAGHLVGTADPGDPLYNALVERQIGTLRLSA